MVENRKYYWLRLKQDFFDNLRMKKLRSIAGGDTYTIIYLKMQLLSLQDEGFLYYEKVEDTFEQELALLINENIEDVKITVNFLIANNLLKEVEDGKYELIETRTCIGSETDKAEFMRNLRARRKQELIQTSNIVTNLLPDVTNCYTEKEIEKDINIDKDKNKNKNKKKKKETEFDILINNNFLDEELKNTVYEFIKMRKAIKKPLTTKGLELMIKKLYDLSNNIDEQIQILNNSIMNNWQGIFALKKEKNNSKGKFDDFKEIWEEAKIQDEQARNGTSNNFVSW